MKVKPVLFSALAVALLFSACNQKAKNAKAYHDNLLHSVQVVIDSSLEYGDAVQSHEKDRMFKSQQQYSSLVDRTIAKINADGSFEDDTLLKHYSLELLGFYRTTLDSDFTPFLKIWLGREAVFEKIWAEQTGEIVLIKFRMEMKYRELKMDKMHFPLVFPGC